MTFSSDKPKSWFVFLATLAAAFLIFVPLAVIGLNTKGIPMFLTGLTGAGITWIAAAFLAMWLATRVHQGRYQNLQRAPWRDQVWVALLAVPVVLGAALPLPARAQYAASTFASTLSLEELRDCMGRDEAMIAREARLDSWKLDNDREAEAIARAGSALADENRRLDARDTAAVAAYNARAAEQNRWVETHNRRAADLNAATARVNGDRAQLTATCGTRPFYPSDRDQILWERRNDARR